MELIRGNYRYFAVCLLSSLFESYRLILEEDELETDECLAVCNRISLDLLGILEIAYKDCQSTGRSMHDYEYTLMYSDHEASLMLANIFNDDVMVKFKFLCDTDRLPVFNEFDFGHLTKQAYAIRDSMLAEVKPSMFMSEAVN